MQNKVEPSVIEYAIISIFYRDAVYKSEHLDLTNDSKNVELVTTLSEFGTDALSMFKMPVSKYSFMVFSRKQLDECLFEIEIKSKKVKQQLITS